MRDQERLTRPVVVALPAEIDIANAEYVGEHLRSAFAPGVTTEMGLPVFAAPLAALSRLAAHKRATNWLTNPDPEIGDCRRSNHVRQTAEPIAEPAAALCRPSADEPAPASPASAFSEMNC